MMSKARLELGRILATPGALRVLGSTTAVAEAPPLRGLGRGGLPNTGRLLASDATLGRNQNRQLGASS
jgi:hypothetical protein